MRVLRWNLLFLFRQYFLHHGRTFGRPISHTSIQVHETMRHGVWDKGEFTIDIVKTDAQILREI